MNAKNTNLLEAEGASQCHPNWDELVTGTKVPNTRTTRAAQPHPQPFALVGKLRGFASSGLPLVDFAGNPQPEPLAARHVCPIAAPDLGREAVLVFENNDLGRPIIMGLLQSALTEPREPTASPVNASLDGKEVTLTAENEIVLRCGKASITLTRAGKVLINGEYLLSRSVGVNRIKGGSVQIN